MMFNSHNGQEILTEERRRCSFSMNDMHVCIDGSAEFVAAKSEIFKILENVRSTYNENHIYIYR